MPAMMQIGQQIGDRYEVVDLICEGGQASLAKGTDRETGDIVAIRQLAAAREQPGYAQERARFERAALERNTVVEPRTVHERVRRSGLASGLFDRRAAGTRFNEVTHHELTLTTLRG